ncbi:hypothetical protein BS17DRAFT_458461 [Gyrodon lividus]|nr:hypothetical protein BS17DRAFT_458461 [Gyrodon lividus]
MSQGDVENQSSHSPRSRSCEARGRPSVMHFLHGSIIPPPEERSLPPTDAFSLSPVSAHSCTESWSGSSSTGEQRSPLTPEFGPPAVPTVVRTNDTPITAFLSQFYDAEPSSDIVQSKLSVGEDVHTLKFSENRKEEMSLMQLPIFPPERIPDYITAEMPDTPFQVSPEDDLLVEPAPVVVEHEIEPHPPLPDVRRARRFACDFLSAGWSERPPSAGLDQRPALPRPTGVKETSAISQELNVSLSLANLSASSSTMPLAFEFPCPPPINRNIGLLSERETKKVQEFLREWGEREGRRWGAEDSPTLHLHHDNAPQIPFRSGDRTSDEFSWEARDSDSDDINGFGGATRCSALIHEVSLMVGLPSDEDQLLPSDGRPIPDVPEHVEWDSQDIVGTTDILVERLPPLPPGGTQPHFSSLRRPRNIRLVPPEGELQSEKRRGALHGAYPFLARKCKSVDEVPIKTPQPPILPLSPQKSPAVRPRGIAVPTPRYKSAETIRPSLSARRCQGQVFPLKEPTGHGPSRSAVDIDEAFIHPREPVPKPTTSPAKRISALDRLESSLIRLKAHAPGHHHKSQSETEGSRRSFKDLVQTKEKRPSFPSVLRPRKQRSSHDISHRDMARPARGRHFSSPVPPVSGPSWAAPQATMESTCVTALLNATHHSEKRAPVGSFMDMDAPTRKPTQPHRTSFRSSVNKEKVKKLVRAAARMSQGVVAWGKNLAGSKKSASARGEDSPSQSA